MNLPLHFAETTLGRVSYRKLGEGSRKILFFHGFPGSSAQIQIFNNLVPSLDLEVICFDRPGYNGTHIQTNEMLKDTLCICEELAKLHHWLQIEVVTLSGGTPYGLSLALQKPYLVSRCHIVCGLGYLNNPQVRKLFSFLKIFVLSILPKVPGSLLRRLISPEFKKNKASNKKNYLFEFFYPRSASDIEVTAQGSVAQSVQLALAEAFRFHSLGPQYDSQVFLSNWGAQLSTLQQPIHFWHGDTDFVIPHKVSQIMSQLIPQAELTIIANEGHLSLPIRHMKQVLMTN